MLSRLDMQQSERELKLGRAVAEGAVGRPVPHLAYPHGTRDTFGRREMTLASELGFASAVTAEPGIVKSGDVEMLALPRIAWDDSRKSLRAWRALLAGYTIRPNGKARYCGRRRTRHPLDERHRRQHPGEPDDDVIRRLQPAGAGDHGQLRDHHRGERPHRCEQQQQDGSDQLSGADTHA